LGTREVPDLFVDGLGVIADGEVIVKVKESLLSPSDGFECDDVDDMEGTDCY